ncbi:helix-turn-helix domain-containing protein [Intrasporangium sp.]|uniref:helix-turn-helix domain-containing protein n=1 Tax=Intrasporangium sp. TaxID=1925024 RepID=UPI002939EBA5|nr:helix-turn-helix domain-containing protein [Intrasporangium sp.]MDV3221823.1 LuxR C-terminal-related transcriptional regulator [Intrasporangium sp.]
MPLSLETQPLEALSLEALSLEPLGLSTAERQVYLRLVELGTADTKALAGDLGRSVEKVTAALNRLATRGLAHREDFGGRRFRVISPDVALPELIRQRQRQLNQLQDETERICEAVARRAGGGCEVVERIVGPAAVHDACAQIQRTARSEVLMVDAPPYFVGGVQPNESEFVALAAGVSYRVIYHRDAIAGEEARAAMRQYVAAGEQARVNAEVWPKLLIADRGIGLVPESAQDPDPERRLLIRSSSLLDVLITHFEHLWERSMPVEALTRTGSPEDLDSAERDPGISERDREMLTLMAAGLKDRAIARSLGITERTVGRRINDLMRRLDADTRFRAGVRAVQRGWITG